ncbi:hypothetical protein [Mucilaginibacter ginsenosidivorans]|uniref:Uncharacterized protein n=1 Tax=Mucilaginibacter ginsenosidivorans TaxID=398053 RepID=A0A5B8V1W8_9SPHI|nr:hypothetical protein [Mucilaginibacter ginsenosidivorans]QEC65374.1 hypothetical protein FRZ54_23300 [Mucilaginibacter ginsenosidivorans]
MKSFVVKFRLIFVPYLIVSTGTIVIYSFLRWLLFIKSNAIVVDEDILNFWAPCFLVWIPIYIWLGPRIKILDLTARGVRSDPFAGFMLLGSMAVLAPTVLAQTYLETATGKLTKLDRISQIDSVAQTKFYSVKTFYADKKLARFKPYIAITNKSSNFDMSLYLVVPVYNSNHVIKKYSYRIGKKGDTATMNNALLVINGHPSLNDTLSWINPRSIKHIRMIYGETAKRLFGERAAKGAVLVETVPYTGPDTLQTIINDNGSYKPYSWFAIRYFKTVKNNLSSEGKDKAYQQFVKESQADFNDKPLDKFTYLDRVPYGNDIKKYIAAINAEIYSPVSTPKNILVPIYESFDKRNGSNLPWIFGSFGIGSAVLLLLLLWKPLRPDLEYMTDSLDKTQQIIDEITAKR